MAATDAADPSGWVSVGSAHNLPVLAELISADNVVVRFDGCGTFAQRRLRHVLSDEPLTDPCVRHRRSVATPATTFYIYDVVPPG